MIRQALALALFSTAPFAIGDEAGIRRMLLDKLGGTGQLESLQRAPFGDLYEAVIRAPDGVRIYYVDSRATVIIVGKAIDAKTDRHLTDDRLRSLKAARWEGLPLQWAITSIRGNGRRKIAVFSDPNCAYCKRLEESLAKLDDITVHILTYPVLGPESVRLTRTVWCAKDRAQAWNDLMFRRVAPPGKSDCDTPIEQVLAYGRSIGVDSTPTWFLESGERYRGALPLDKLKSLLDSASQVRLR